MFTDGNLVELLDTPYNRMHGVVGRVGEIRFAAHTLGLLIRLQEGKWLYYFKKEINDGLTKKEDE